MAGREAKIVGDFGSKRHTSHSGGAARTISYSMLVEQFNIRVRELDLAFPNLPPAFDGYSILHLSDLHLTKLGLLEKRMMEIIDRREFDACLITGDVTKDPRASDIFRRVCSTIRQRDGIYMVLGNSERKPWLDTAMLVQALSFEGNNILINSSTSIRRGDQKITLVGVDDAYSSTPMSMRHSGRGPQRLHYIYDALPVDYSPRARPRRGPHSGRPHPRRPGALSGGQAVLDAHARQQAAQRRPLHPRGPQAHPANGHRPQYAVRHARRRHKPHSHTPALPAGDRIYYIAPRRTSRSTLSTFQPIILQ